MSEFFYDSYAIIEYINGNPAYKIYFMGNSGITTLYNIMEVYYSVLKEEGEAKAKEVLQLLSPIVVYPGMEDVEPAMKFRFSHKEKKLSYADCLGYALARKRKLRFLTGDEGFRHLPHVEFVK